MKFMKIADQRKSDTKKTIKCPRCSLVNWDDYMNCYDCTNKLHPPAYSFKIMYGKPGRMMGETRYRKAMDFERRHGEDLIQPYTYDKSQKKMIKNPDFIKYYGDPEKKVDAGSGVEQDLKDKNIQLNAKEDF